MRKRAFTLGEILTVLAILALLAVLVMPVFLQARESAKATKCVSNFHQVSLAMSLYQSDYDDVFVIPNYKAASNPDAYSDRTWVQIVLPYVRDFRTFQCPSDYTHTSDSPAFEPDLGTGDASGRFYTASMHSNLGYNYYYLSPIQKVSGQWLPVPRSAATASDPSNTLVLADSVWQVRDGQPEGGGSYLISPPCRYENVLGRLEDSFRFGSEGAVLARDHGWSLEVGSENYGHVWFWHRKRATVVRLDGSAKSLGLTQFSKGCSLAEFWSGRIQDPSDYMWDLR